MAELGWQPYWHKVAMLLAAARSPAPTPNVVSILQFGAVGDGKTDCSAAFERALAALTPAGGVLLVPREEEGRESIFVTRPLHLNVSRLTFRIEAGATVKAGCDIAAWPVEPPWPMVAREGNNGICGFHWHRLFLN